ncbi:unnamed protein product, partial [Mesorhabditis belari]|uniref:Uncharacterized protein n=1 Tax=Mesorhabditis belari TaxID=2138241 RepID=A0AAF3EF29_9BILA
MLNVGVKLFVLLFSSGLVRTGDSDDSAVPQWPPGAYCLLAAEGGCFEPFYTSTIQLAVPKVIQPGDTYHDDDKNTTERFIKYGKVGDSLLKIHDFDQVYRLKIVACCKNQ